MQCFEMMQKFQPVCKLRILMLNYALNYFQFESKTTKLAKVFSYIDYRHKALLTERELFKFAQRIYHFQDQAKLRAEQAGIAEKLDFSRNGGISYSDFLIACLDY